MAEGRKKLPEKDALKARLYANHTETNTVLTTLIVNGKTYQLKVEPNKTLADILRWELHLTGTKVACDRGECGACTVLMEGMPILSCMTLAIACDGKRIETIEGLAGPSGKMHPIQRIFVDNDGLQCGFCTPGVLMTVKALLDNNPSPSEAEVRKALSGNICRCSAYPNIIKSTLLAAEAIKAGGQNG